MCFEDVIILPGKRQRCEFFSEDNYILITPTAKNIDQTSKIGVFLNHLIEKFGSIFLIIRFLDNDIFLFIHNNEVTQQPNGTNRYKHKNIKYTI